MLNVLTDFYFIFLAYLMLSIVIVYGYENMLIELSHVRRHIEFNMDENEAVRNRLIVFTMAHTIKVLVSCNFHNFQNFSTTSKKIFCSVFVCLFFSQKDVSSAEQLECC